MPLAVGEATAAVAPLEAFAGTTSVKVGGTIEFYARNPAGSYFFGSKVAFGVTRMAVADQVMLTTTVTVANETVPSDASANGCRSWGVAHRLKVPTTWPSGLYWATFGTGSTACCVPFVVRPASRTKGVTVLVQIPVTTAQAYNPYGGKSLYEYNSSGGVRGTRVSFNRPFADQWNNSFDPWQPHFVRWLEKNGIAADFCTSMDLEGDATLLNGYRLFATAGHDEYWSRTMRDRLDAFVALGGNAAIFSGNSCFWQVRFDDNGGTDRRMICFKSRTADTGGTAATKTTYWADLATPYPENTTIGLSFVKGASWTNAMARPVSPWVVQEPDHWVFAGTNLAAGASFGGAYVGYEVDAADFRTGTDGRFYPTGLDGTPATLRILAQADCSDWDARAKALGLPGERSGYGAIGIFSRGGSQGTVFNAGSTDWAYGLRPELEGQSATVIGTITRNVFQKLAGAWTETAQVRQWRSAPAPTAAAAGGTVGTMGVVVVSTYATYATVGTEVPEGMVLDGQVFRALPAAGTGTTPVYRYRSNSPGANGHSYALSTQSALPASWPFTKVGVAFHAYAAARAGAVPVYQHSAVDAAGLAVLRYSTSATASAGWSVDGVAFHAPAA